MPEFTFFPVWRKNDSKVEADVKATWAKHNILPEGVDPEKRVKQLCVVAYEGDQVAGISTMDIAPYKPLRKRFGFFRAFTIPGFGNQDIARGLAVNCRDVLNQWSIDNPQEAVAGMMAVYQAKGMGRRPVGVSGLTLIGYTPEGYQVRVIWFDHVTIDV
ncbi:MAG: hypothetical protein GC184_06940 [Rhizobiales bacterium]|nr:hypothetical protein [Hyphomicrobiales bacterium]